MSRTFTSLEMLTVLAVVSILAALSIPMLHGQSLLAKRVEVRVNVDGIKDAVVAYDAAFDRDPPNGMPHPVGTAGRRARPWKPAPAEWNNLGWAPDGDVYGVYAFYMPGPGVPNPRVWSLTDVDADGTSYIHWQLHYFDPSGADRGWLEGACCSSDPSQCNPVPPECY